MTGKHSTLMRVTAVAGAMLFLPISLVGAVAAGLAQLPADATASTLARSDIPSELLPLYQQAVLSCPGLGWPVVAGVGKVESDHNRPPGQTSDAGAQGPMQFLPATWTAYGVDGNLDGRADPFDPADAIPAAAEYLCRHGAARDTAGAVAAYLCGGVTSCVTAARGPGGYATRVLDWAARYSDSTAGGSAAATLAVQTALAQVGTPYVWGGQTPGLGFDCSGLVQYAYSAAGIALPRTAQTQYDHGPHLAPTEPVLAGDLVFFGSDSGHVTHVGIALGQGRMVDAPHTGALVRVEPIAGFTGRRTTFLGATRPAAIGLTRTQPATGTLPGPVGRIS